MWIHDMNCSQRGEKRAMFVGEGNVSNGVRDIAESKKKLSIIFPFSVCWYKDNPNYPSSLDHEGLHVMSTVKRQFWYYEMNFNLMTHQYISLGLYWSWFYHFSLFLSLNFVVVVFFTIDSYRWRLSVNYGRHDDSRLMIVR